MKKKYLIIGSIVGIIIMGLIIGFVNIMGDSKEEQIVIADKDDYSIQFYMAEKESIFFRVQNNSQEELYVKIDNVTSNGKAISLKGYSGFDRMEHEMEVGSTENWENFKETFDVISLTEYVGPQGSNIIDFGMLGDGQVYNLKTEEVKGTISLYTLNVETGEYRELEEFSFTIPAEYDGQIF